MLDLQSFSNPSVKRNNLRVLYFGRKNCTASDKALEYLLMLGFEVNVILSEGFGKKLPDNINEWEGDFILCFRSYFILRKPLLEKAKIAAINFHPGPPEYPGSGCLNYALFERANQYGVTAHIINEKIDNGRIIKVNRFPIFSNDDVNTLLTRTHHQLLQCFYEVLGGISSGLETYISEQIKESSNEAWNGEARRMKELSKYQLVSKDISQDSLTEKVRAFHTESYPIRLHIHGYEFILKGKAN